MEGSGGSFASVVVADPECPSRDAIVMTVVGAMANTCRLSF